MSQGHEMSNSSRTPCHPCGFGYPNPPCTTGPWHDPCRPPLQHSTPPTAQHPLLVPSSIPTVHTTSPVPGTATPIPLQPTSGAHLQAALAYQPTLDANTLATAIAHPLTPLAQKGTAILSWPKGMPLPHMTVQSSTPVIS